MRLAERTVGRPETSRPRFSRLTGAAFLALFLTGVATGAVAYLRRSPVTEPHAAGANAITVHVLLAVGVALIVLGVQAWLARGPAPRGPSPWTAPFTARAAARLGRTVRCADGRSVPNVARVVVAVPLAGLLAFLPYRMGAQVTGGLDPNATVNAWGGPGYAGALLAHGLDAAICCYAAAFLLSRLLLPER